ncbi:MAG TPA: RluA family pseudouridine synthase [Acidimicrobiales bacterium]|nr:RluA family pseudouridine synthase [Acidimicrobiales bacterium]
MNEPIPIPATLAGTRLDRVLALLTGMSRSDSRLLLERGAVRLGGEIVTAPSRKTRTGELLEVDTSAIAASPRTSPPEPSPEVEFGVVYEDDEIVVVDKPPGLVVHPGAGNRTGTLVSGLLHRFPDLAALGEPGTGGDPDRPGIVHRLDKDTSGLIVVARTARARTSLAAQLADRSAGREYVVIACGSVGADEGVVDAPLGRSGRDPTLMAITGGGRAARTNYSVTARYTSPIPLTELSVRLQTGRTHQIRVHLSAIGHPVLGDAKYGGRRKEVAATRPFLHAHRLTILHPATGEQMSWVSPLPRDLEEVRALLSR